MTNDEERMTNEARMTNASKTAFVSCFVLRHSFVIGYFVIRHYLRAVRRCSEKKLVADVIVHALRRTAAQAVDL